MCSNVGAIAAKIMGKPHFWFIHEFGEEDQHFRLSLPTPKAYRFMAFLSRKIIVNSKAVMKKWEKYVQPEKLALLYNLVQLPLTNSIGLLPEEKPFRLLMLGQLIRGKGHRDAILAVRSLNKEGVFIHLDIIGSAWDRSYLIELQTLISQNKLEEYIKILPPVTHPERIFRKYHILLMCSLSEAFGRVTVEALKSGIPVIASRTGGSTEIIEEGRNGFFYDPTIKDSLAQEIKKIMNPEIYKALKSETSRVNLKFNPEVIKQQLENIFC
jgi:glycosyltransferase involved in cell wall biosynthesis